jgi:Right handed beta helix region
MEKTSSASFRITGTTRPLASCLALVGISGLTFFVLSMLSITALGAPSKSGSTVDATAFSNLSTAVSSFGGRNATISVSTPQKINTLTIPGNIRLKLTRKGRIEVAAGKTVVLNGPFEAPLAKVFGDSGTVRFARTALSSVHPEWWGAGDNLRSATAIQSAIDSLEKGEVLLSSGTYLLDRRRRIRLTDSGDSVDVILVPKSGVSITGKGYGSVLKVTDNFTEAGDYVVFAPLKGEAVSDISFRNFRIDGNGSRNLVKGSTGASIRRGMAIWLFAGKNVRVEGVWFENQPGMNVVKFGSDSLSYLVTDSVIENCVFSHVGGAIAGNRRQSDHSTLYISGRNVTVRNNRLSNPEPYNENGPPGAVVAGIEMHGSDMTVTGNRVENYGTGGYIVSDGYVAAANQRWTGNTFLNMTKIGISLWSIQKVRNIVIDSNTIKLYGELDQCVAGIYQSLVPPDTTMGFDGLTISGNTISGGRAKRGGTVWNGIQLTAATNAVIRGNTIDTVSGAGILLIGNRQRPLDCANILIEGNTVRDTSFNGYGAYPFAIDITNEGLGRFADIRVVGNGIESSGFSPAMRGIRVEGKGPFSRVKVEKTNRFSGIPEEHRMFGKGID